jgi:hypothetical protein
VRELIKDLVDKPPAVPGRIVDGEDHERMPVGGIGAGNIAQVLGPWPPATDGFCSCRSWPSRQRDCL